MCRWAQHRLGRSSSGVLFKHPQQFYAGGSTGHDLKAGAGLLVDHCLIFNVTRVSGAFVKTPMKIYRYTGTTIVHFSLKSTACSPKVKLG